MSPFNIEEEHNGGDLTVIIVAIKTKVPHLASYARGPTEKLSEYERWHLCL